MSMSTRSKARSRAEATATASTSSAAVPSTSSSALSQGATSPPAPDKCTICLADVVNKCKTDSCRHEFCYACLLEWSKVKAECPLCKTEIKKIIYNIKNVGGTETHDEYNVPPTANNHFFDPPPQVSIQVAASFRPGPGTTVYRSRNFEDYLESIIRFTPDSFPLTSNGGPPLAHSASYLSDRFNGHEPSYLRILEVGLTGGVPERSTFTSDDGGFDNPFNGPDDRDSPSYQRRRRIYDRAQYVAPFASTLQAGTVFFPSVEYFRTHPTAYGRIRPWLRRELTVLIGLRTQRSSMAALYDLILSLLLRYDIRSREFREMIRIYFTSSLRVKHFQHEFYHFVLSGMRLEEYDNVAEYSGGNETNTSSDNGNRSQQPPVITLDDTDSNDQPQSSEAPPPATHRHRHSRKSRNSKHGRRQSKKSQPALNTEPTASTSRSARGITFGESIEHFVNNFSPVIDLSSRSTRMVVPSPTEDLQIPGTSQSQSLFSQQPTVIHKREVVDDGSDSDDCQLLGIHPIVKPPPLAVITIDSDDEPNLNQNDNGANNDRNQNGEQQSVEIDTGSSIINSSPIDLSSGTVRVPEVVTIDDSSSSSFGWSMDLVDLSSPPVPAPRPSSPQPSTSSAAVDPGRRSYKLNGTTDRLDLQPYFNGADKRMEAKRAEESPQRFKPVQLDSSDSSKNGDSSSSEDNGSNLKVLRREIEKSRKRLKGRLALREKVKRRRSKSPKLRPVRGTPSPPVEVRSAGRLRPRLSLLPTKKLRHYSSSEGEWEKWDELAFSKVEPSSSKTNNVNTIANGNASNDSSDDSDTQPGSSGNQLLNVIPQSARRWESDEDEDVKLVSNYEPVPSRSTEVIVDSTSSSSLSSSSSSAASTRNTEDPVGFNVGGSSPLLSSATAQVLYPDSGIGEALQASRSYYENLFDVDFGEYSEPQRTTYQDSDEED